MHYYKRNLGDYAKKAGRLSMLQHGAYTLLIDSCYDREKFPTKLEAIEWCWASTSEEKEAVNFVLNKFFVEINGLYIQNRIQDELDEYREFCANQTEKGRKGGRPKLIKNNPTGLKNNPTGLKNNPLVTQANPGEPGTNPIEPELTLTTNHKPLTTNHKPLTNITFDQFYSAYPKKEKRADAEKIWNKIDDCLKEKIIDDVKNRTLNHEGWKEKQYIPQPSAYLNGKRWEDEMRPYQQSKQTHLEKTISSLTDFISSKENENDYKRLA
jgi:uncharacterized protein YdaU (DUF1376 family)